MKPQPPKRPPKKLSLASEVLDAEVTAITNSGGSSGPDEEEEEEVDSMKKVGPVIYWMVLTRCRVGWPLIRDVLLCFLFEVPITKARPELCNFPLPEHFKMT